MPSQPSLTSMNETCRHQAQFVADRVSSPAGRTEIQVADSKTERSATCMLVSFPIQRIVRACSVHLHQTREIAAGQAAAFVFGNREAFEPVEAGEVIDAGMRSPEGDFIDHVCSDHDILVGTLTFRSDSSLPPDPTDPPLPPTEPGPVDSPPFVRAGPDVSGAEGAPIILAGVADDDNGTPTVSWSYDPVSGVDSGTRGVRLAPYFTRRSSPSSSAICRGR